MQGKSQSFRLKETDDFNEIMKTISENRKRKNTEKNRRIKARRKERKKNGAKRTANR